MSRCATRSIFIDADPDVVMNLVGDPHALPRWAPRFATAVRRHGDTWLVGAAGQERAIRVRVGRSYRTVDFLPAKARGPVTGGFFGRVLPNGGGSELVFSLLLPDGESDDAIAERMDVVEEELRTVRKLCEAPA